MRYKNQVQIVNLNNCCNICRNFDINMRKYCTLYTSIFRPPHSCYGKIMLARRGANAPICKFKIRFCHFEFLTPSEKIPLYYYMARARKSPQMQEENSRKSAAEFQKIAFRKKRTTVSHTVGNPPENRAKFTHLA